MVRRSWAAMILALVATSSPLRATAQTRPSAVARDRDEARRHFNRAIELMRSAQWLDAIPELEAARRLGATLPVLFNLGLAQRAVGRDLAAIATFREFLQLAGDEVASNRRAEVNEYIATLTASIAHLRIRATPGEARVTIDGIRDDSPAQQGLREVEIDPGRHVVLVEENGFQPMTRSIELRAGERHVEEFALESATGRVIIDASEHEARIEVDGRFVGVGAASLDVESGTHRVLVTAAGFEAFRDDVAVNVGGSIRIHAGLSRAPASRSPWLWVGVGAGAAAVIAGAVVAGVLLSGTAEPIRPDLGIVMTSTAGR